MKDAGGLSLTDAAKIATEAHGVNVPVLSEAFAQWVMVKKSEGHTANHTKEIARRVGEFVNLYATKRPSEITTGDVDKFLAGLKSLGRAQWTIKTYRRDIVTFFTWCNISQEWCKRNPAAHAAKQNTRSEKIHILTPEEAARLLHSCDEGILAAVAVQMFCPTRHAEVKKLDWKAVDLDQKVLMIDSDIAKTKARRVMNIPANAVEILKKCKEREGSILPKNYYTLFDEAKIGAGFSPTDKAQHDLSGKKLSKWPNNVLRHSAISYTLAKNGDIFKTATSAGNSPSIVQEHYLQLVKPSDATAYFAITA